MSGGIFFFWVLGLGRVLVFFIYSCVFSVYEGLVYCGILKSSCGIKDKRYVGVDFFLGCLCFEGFFLYSLRVVDKSLKFVLFFYSVVFAGMVLVF